MSKESRLLWGALALIVNLVNDLEAIVGPPP